MHSTDFDSGCLQRIYGEDAVPGVTFDLKSSGKHHLTHQDVLNLLRGIFGAHHAPLPWANFRNIPLVHCVQCILFERVQDKDHHTHIQQEKEQVNNSIINRLEALDFTCTHTKFRTDLQSFQIFQDARARGKRKLMQEPSIEDKEKTEIASIIRKSFDGDLPSLLPNFKRLSKDWIEKAESFVLNTEELQSAGFFEPSDRSFNAEVTNSCSSGTILFPIIAMDCEMCLSSCGYELTRVSLVDAVSNKLLLDTFVKPKNKIIDYLTEFSGIQESDLENCSVNLPNIRASILDTFIFRETILLGHSLENDLRAMGIMHERVIDTSLLYRHPLGLPNRHALRFLSHRYLSRVIQSGEHNSIEDALACADLLKLKLTFGESFGTPKPHEKSVIMDLLDEGIYCKLIGRAAPIHTFLSANPAQSRGLLDTITVSTNAKAAQSLKTALRDDEKLCGGKSGRRFFCTSFPSSSVQDLAKVLEEGLQKLPKNTVTLAIALQARGKGDDHSSGIVGINVKA